MQAGYRFRAWYVQDKSNEAALLVTASDECGNESTCEVELCVQNDEGGDSNSDSDSDHEDDDSDSENESDNDSDDEED